MTKRFRFTALLFTALLGMVYYWQVSLGINPGFNAASSPWWKFFTSVLGHSDLQHLLNNAFFLGLFGSIYERVTSGKTFLTTFFVSALFANLTAFIFFPDSFIIGASGGAMGVLAALAVYQPRRIGLVFGVPAPMWAVLLGYIFLNAAGLTANNNVAYEAHLFGLVIGSIIGYRLRDRPFFDGDEEEDPEETEWKRRIREWEKKYMLDQGD